MTSSITQTGQGRAPFYRHQNLSVADGVASCAAEAALASQVRNLAADVAVLLSGLFLLFCLLAWLLVDFCYIVPTLKARKCLVAIF